MEQSMLNGMMSGLALSVLALSFAIVYTSTGIFHIMLAGVFALAPYIAWSLMDAGVLVAATAAIAAGAVVSLTCERFNHAPLIARHASSGAHLISSLGLYMITVQVIALAWGDEARVLRTGIDDRVGLAGLSLTTTQCWSAGISVVALVAISVWLFRSRSGLLFRAVADDPTEYELRGFSVVRTRMLAFALSGGLGSIVALTEASEFGFNPHGGLHAVLLAMVAVMLVKKLSIYRIVAASVAIGVGREVVTWALSSTWAEALTFGVLAVLLFARTVAVGVSAGEHR